MILYFRKLYKNTTQQWSNEYEHIRYHIRIRLLEVIFVDPNMAKTIFVGPVVPSTNAGFDMWTANLTLNTLYVVMFSRPRRAT